MPERAVPILPSRDLDQTLGFYQALGFENRGAPPEAWDYLILGRGEVELHFTPEPSVDPFATAGSCYLYVDDADGLFAEWRGLIATDVETGSRLTSPTNAVDDHAPSRSR